MLSRVECVILTPGPRPVTRPRQWLFNVLNLITYMIA
jgi:hypothetical protein